MDVALLALAGGLSPVRPSDAEVLAESAPAKSFKILDETLLILEEVFCHSPPKDVQEDLTVRIVSVFIQCLEQIVAPLCDSGLPTMLKQDHALQLGTWRPNRFFK